MKRCVWRLACLRIWEQSHIRGSILARGAHKYCHKFLERLQGIMSHELVIYESLADIEIRPKVKWTINLDNFERSYKLLGSSDQSDNLLLQDFHDHVKDRIQNAAIDKTFGIRLLEDGKIVRHDFLQDLVIERYLMARIALMIASHKMYIEETCLPLMETMVTTALTKIPGNNLKSWLQQYVLTFGLELNNYIFVFNFDAIIAASAMEAKMTLNPGSVQKEFVYHGSSPANVFAIGHQIRCYTPPRQQFFSLLQPCVEKRCSGMYWSRNKHEASTYATPCGDDKVRYLACGKLRYDTDKRVTKGDVKLDQPVIVQNIVKHGTRLNFGSTILVENAAQFVHVTGILSMRPANAAECAAEISAAVEGGKKFELCVQMWWRFMLLYTHSVLKRKHSQFLCLDKNIEMLQSEDSELHKVAEQHKKLEKEFYKNAPRQGIPRPCNFHDSQDSFWMDHETILKRSEVLELEKLFQANPKEYAREENWGKIIAMAKAQFLRVSFSVQFWKNLNPRQLTQILLDDEILNHHSIAESERYDAIVHRFVNMGVSKMSAICKVLQVPFGSYIFGSYFHLKDMNKHLPVNEISKKGDMDILFANIVLRASLQQQNVQTPVIWSSLTPQKWGLKQWVATFKSIFETMKMDATEDGATSFPVSKEAAYMWAGDMFDAFVRQLCSFRASENGVHVQMSPESNICFLQAYIFPIIPMLFERHPKHNIERSRDLYQTTHQLYLDQLDQFDKNFEFAAQGNCLDPLVENSMIINILDHTGLDCFAAYHPMSFLLAATHDPKLTVERLRLIVDRTIVWLQWVKPHGENCGEDNKSSKTKSFFVDLRQYLEASMGHYRVSCIFSCMHKSFFKNTRTVRYLPRRHQLQAPGRNNILEILRTDLLYETTKKTWMSAPLCVCDYNSKTSVQFRVKVLDVVSGLNEFDFRRPATSCTQTVARDSWLLVVDLANKDDETQVKNFKMAIRRTQDKYKNKQLLTTNERAHCLILKLDQIENYDYMCIKRKHNDTTANNAQKTKKTRRK